MIPKDPDGYTKMPGPDTEIPLSVESLDTLTNEVQLLAELASRMRAHLIALRVARAENIGYSMQPQFVEINNGLVHAANIMHRVSEALAEAQSELTTCRLLDNFKL